MQRNAVIAEARTWIGTPFHHAAQIKGVGVDCAMFPLAVYSAIGAIKPFKVSPYSAQWHLHQDAERYLQIARSVATEIENPQPGDFALFKFGRCYSHGAIITGYPELIHAYIGQGVAPARADQQPLAGRPVKFFTVCP
jgi:NlpC/P60 family putative phage cell wall peptidase